MSEVLVSIITPTYNRGERLKVAARSIISQEHKNLEWLIIDDLSSDETEAIVKGLIEKDSRIRYLIRTSGPKGANRCRNIGIAEAKGDYIVFLDSDDSLLPCCISGRLASIAEFEQLDFMVFPGVVYFNNGEYKTVKWNIEREFPDLQRFLLFDGVWQTSGAIWRKSSVKSKELTWDENLTLWQDVDFHCRAILAGLSYKVCWDKPMDYLVKGDSNDSISRNNYHSKDKIESRIYFWNKYLSYSGIKRDMSPVWYRYLFLFAVSGALISGNFKLYKTILADASRHGIISILHKWLFFLGGWISFKSGNRISFLFSALKKRIVNFNPTVQIIPVETTADIRSYTSI